MVVTKDEYEKCHSAHPIFFSNNGVTAFTLHRPGLFYFISGVSGHCERGQKMIIKVLEPASPPQSADQNEQKNDAAVAMAAITSATLMSYHVICGGPFLLIAVISDGYYIFLLVCFSTDTPI
ncbi:early nodulin-like protein 1 [Prunus dulcis]|uniref:early nodulin-like protein 1 n=1 Tax=Prunus dulcis TaxID=3755 RepID=UPI001481F642|nr:early nodulin-like protein 1 [Prunus dulcis]